MDLIEPPESELLDRITRSGDGGAVHLVRIIQRGDSYSFDPPEVDLPTGDVIRFVMAGARPESVMFDPAGATPEAADFIRERSLDFGVLLIEPGQSHDVSFRGAPPGSYPFLSIPHLDRGMSGVARVIE